MMINYIGKENSQRLKEKSGNRRRESGDWESKRKRCKIKVERRKKKKPPASWRRIGGVCNAVGDGRGQCNITINLGLSREKRKDYAALHIILWLKNTVQF